MAACGGDDDSTKSSSPAPTGSGATATPHDVTIRLGYFANVTHGQPLVGVDGGIFAPVLGDHVKVSAKIFNAGPAEIEALFAGEIDAGYVGPSPAVNGWIKSKGDALQIVAGAASAGALFIVRPEANITKAADLANKKIASPQLGNTQDVALRAYVQQNGLKTKENGGNVTILPTANADTLTLFKKGDIDGAWVPEPWASRLVSEAGGKVFVDERTLWPNGQFATTVLVVNRDFLKKEPAAVQQMLAAHIAATQYLNEKPEEAKTKVNDAIKKLSGAAMTQDVIDSAWKNLTFTNDPLASTVKKGADDAFKLGFLGSTPPGLKGLFSLDFLNKALSAAKQGPVKE